YRGLGDIFVFLFFGPIGVAGSYFLMSKGFEWSVLLPASSMGLLSVGVLNVNNMRDHISDKMAGKISLVVKMGFENAKIYHSALILLAFISMTIFVHFNDLPITGYSFLLAAPLFILHLRFVWKTNAPELLDKQLKILALSTLVFCLMGGAGLIL
ncbi:MAG: 1,4-dihydroxy-2-naphthoate octaprenyltransferase, partial [Chitinophagales bacterium]